MRNVKTFFYNNEIAIEYSIAGEGTPVLVMHGGHSSCNEEFGYEDGSYFAKRYPERVKSLTLQSALSKEWLTPKDMEYRCTNHVQSFT